MRRCSKFLLVLTLLLGLLCSSCGDQKEALELTCRWARLAPLPNGVQELKVETAGNAASRQFIVTFKTDQATLESWLQASPGISDAELEEKGGVRIYKIKPADAQFAEVRTYPDYRVRIETYWS